MIFRAVEDADLIRKARRGDVEAYNLLISRWERRVYNYLLRIVANREDALDLSQDVFLKAYQNLRKLDDPARFAPWLYRIAHNEAYSLFRKRRPEGETEELQPETMEGAATVGGNAVFPVELTLAVSSALGRAHRRPARDGHSQNLPGLQIRGDRRDRGRPGFHREIAAVHGARPAENRTGSRKSTRCVMSCSPFDLRDYYFKDLAEDERRLTEVHVKTCANCREELDRLRGTETALLALPDEEIPQRIGFVSDPVFEPSAFRRGWDALWGSAARLGFASAAMLSAALVVFSLTRPVPQSMAPAPALTRAAIEARMQVDFSKRLDDAVAKAVAQSEARQARQTRELLDASETRHALETQAMMVRVQEYLDVEKKRMNTLILASNDAASVNRDVR